MKKSQFFLRFTFLTKKQQGEFGRYLISLHPQKQTAIAIYQFYVAHGAGAKQLLLPRQDLAQLIFPKQKAQQVKLNNGLSDLNIVIEEYLHWMTKVKGVRNQQQDLALVEAFSKNGDEKGVDRVVGRLERQLEGETYKNLNHYEVYSKLMDLKIGVPFRKYRKEILPNYRKSAYMRSQWATHAALTFMVEYDCNSVANGFDFDFPMHQELKGYFTAPEQPLDNYLQVQMRIWKLYSSKNFGVFNQFKDEIFELIPDTLVNEKVENIKMLKNFIVRNRRSFKESETRIASFELNKIHLDLMLTNDKSITPLLFMNFVVSSRGISRVEKNLEIYKEMLPVNLRSIYYKLAITELALHYKEDMIYLEYLKRIKIRIPLYEIFRRRIILTGLILNDTKIDNILNHIHNFRQYVLRNKISVSRITSETLAYIRIIELLLNPNATRKQVDEIIDINNIKSYKVGILRCWEKLRPTDRNIPTSW